MSTITWEELVHRVRDDCGNLPDSDASDEVIRRHLEEGLDEINRFVPNRAMYSITLVENKQTYTHEDGGLEEGLLTVLDVFPPYYTLTSYEMFGSDFDVLLGRDILYDWEMSQYDKFVDFMNRQQNYEQFSWDFRTDGSLFLVPPPSGSVAGKLCYYIGTKTWAITSMPPKLVKSLVKYGCAQSLQVAGRRRTRLASPTRTGTQVDYGLYDPLLRDGKALMKEWLEEIETEGNRWFWR